MKEDINWVQCMFCCLMCVIISTCFTGELVTNHLQREAVTVGVAEWVADVNGKPQFRWKKSTPVPAETVIGIPAKTEATP